MIKRTIVLWVVAFLITLLSAVYQRLTGPTYPVKVHATLNETPFSYMLDRSHSTSSDYIINIITHTEGVQGKIEWKRYGTNDHFTAVPMQNVQGILIGELPKQPPAGKLEYKVTLTDGKKSITNGTVIRFKGDVPGVVLGLHVFCMFMGMLFATRAGLEIFSRAPNFRFYTDTAFGLLTVGGMFLGPLVLYYAFGDWWTGWPIGSDITDNKTLIAFVVWLTAAVVVRKAKNPKPWIALAAIITLGVFMIPHSLWGTELNYQTMQRN